MPTLPATESDIILSPILRSQESNLINWPILRKMSTIDSIGPLMNGIPYNYGHWGPSKGLIVRFQRNEPSGYWDR